MNVKPEEERKTMRMKLKLNSKEYEMLKQYTEESGLRSMSQYMLNSIIATPIIEITDEELAPDKARLKEISDSINAIAIRVNQTNKCLLSNKKTAFLCFLKPFFCCQSARKNYDIDNFSCTLFCPLGQNEHDIN